MFDRTVYDQIREIYLLLGYQNQMVLEPFGLTTVQYDTLFHLQVEQGHRMGELCGKALCDNSKMTRIVDYLEQQGWAERRNHPEDRRALLVYLTAAGAEVRTAAQAAHTAALQEQLAVFDADTQQLFSQLLGQFKQHLKETLIEK